ncbi:hypothetical protein [Streptomyces pseudogriseolus]|uniref:hypothetical protein n=1 Tax=Streptomyces pseudogriseolus TaxID=36817 RepID=UPI003FA28B1E
MTSTPRLDSLKTNGTNGDFEGIRLADGHMLSVKTHAAGFAWLQEVFLFPGLTAPDTEAWSNDDPYEVWLTSGDLGEEGGSLYYGVPVEAVRELIVQHGGEHDNQEPPAPAVEGESGEGAAPNPLARIAHLHGRFADGYTPDAIRSVFGRIYDEGGPYLVCVWEYADAYGFGGNSQFYAEGEDGELFEVTPYVHQWLSGQRETPGPLDTWVCAPVTEPTDFPVSDDFHNYARADRTAG